MASQLNDSLPGGDITSVKANYQGKWEWCIILKRGDSHPALYLEFGPTAVIQNESAPTPIEDPDYTKIFVARSSGQGDVDLIAQTSVSLGEVLDGLDPTDTRLRDSMLTLINE